MTATAVFSLIEESELFDVACFEAILFLLTGLKPFSVPALTYEQYAGQRYCT